MHKQKKNLQARNPHISHKRSQTQKIFSDRQKTIQTTKQMTYTTIDEQTDLDIKVLTNANGRPNAKRLDQEKMKAHSLSPFSSPEGHTVVPKIPQVTATDLLKQNQKYKKQIKTKKKVSPTLQQTPKNRRKVVILPSTNFSRYILNVQTRKITQLSQQSAGVQSPWKKSEKISLIETEYCTNQDVLIRQKVTKMYQRIKKQSLANFPTLSINYRKLLSAVVLIQRLWRQKKIRSLINDYSSPREKTISYETTFGKGIYQKECGLLDTQQNQRKCDEGNPNGCWRLSDLELSNQLSGSQSSNRDNLYRFVQCYRDFNIQAKKKKKCQQSPFSFPVSLSEKCLMGTFYRKVFNHSHMPGGQTRFFCSNKKNKGCNTGQQKVIEQQFLLTERKMVQQTINERFTTEQEDSQIDRKAVNPQNQANQAQKQKNLTEDDFNEKKPKTVKKIFDLSGQIVFDLIGEFLVEFNTLKKSKLTEKKKRKLPGIQINQKTIEEFISGVIQYIAENYVGYLQNSFNKVIPLTFLQLCRPVLEEQIFQYGQQTMSDWSIIPNSVFFEYQQIYEKKVFKIMEQDKKYSNFLLSLIKVHNKSLLDCFLEIIERVRTQRVVYPWDRQEIHRRSSSAAISNKQLQKIKQDIVFLSQIRLGSFRRRDMQINEEEKMLAVDRIQFERDGLDWNIRDEKLQLRLDLAEALTTQLYEQFTKELLNFSLERRQL